MDDIDLPDVGTKAGSRITWTTSNPAVVTASGVITRPAFGQGAATATLTARLTKGHEVATRSIAITVLAEFDDAQSVARDTADLVMVGLDDVRGNITLPAAGQFGSAITWAASTPIITPTGEVTRPAYGRPDAALTLTATITKGAASQTKSFPATVKAMPRAEDPERYFLGYFTGEGLADGEQLRFGLSTGNSALDWVGLGGGRPSLVSQLGDQGLRDPFIIRSPDGDTFYMIATDLNWFNRNRDYLINDTQYIEVFESHDLVNWSPQRHVKVAPDNAGNAFAPEAYWDDSIGAYVVFWAQAMWQDPVNRTNPGNQQMWYTTTRDFRTFAPPAVWQDPVAAVADRHHGDQGRGLVLPLHQERGRQRGLGRVLGEAHATCATRTSTTGRRSPRRSAGARGWPTRATRVRSCSRPTRATPPAPSSSTSGPTGTPTAAATSCPAARTSRPRRGRPRRRGSPIPAPCGTER